MSRSEYYFIWCWNKGCLETGTLCGVETIKINSVMILRNINILYVFFLHFEILSWFYISFTGQYVKQLRLINYIREIIGQDRKNQYGYSSKLHTYFSFFWIFFSYQSWIFFIRSPLNRSVYEHFVWKSNAVLAKT